MRSSRRLFSCALVTVFGCGGDPLSFSEEPRPCETRGEVCPARSPTRLHSADLDGDGVAEFITAGLGWEVSVALLTEHGLDYVTSSVPVEEAGLSSCSSGEKSGDWLFYRNYSSEEWWLWRLSGGRLEVVDNGRDPITAVVACVDLGPGADVIATLHDAILTLPTATFELQPVDTRMYALAVMPTADGSRFSLFATVALQPDLYLGTFDLDAGEILQESSLSLDLTRNHIVTVSGRDLIVAGRVDDEFELVIARDLDPAAPVVAEVQRVSLPWQARIVAVGELDGDPDIEIVVAPMMPVTAIAVFGLSPSELIWLELPFEGIDIAVGDHDGDGKDEIYALDPRAERIVQIPLPGD